MVIQLKSDFIIYLIQFFFFFIQFKYIGMFLLSCRKHCHICMPVPNQQPDFQRQISCILYLMNHSEMWFVVLLVLVEFLTTTVYTHGDLFSGITIIRYFHSQNIGNTNNFKKDVRTIYAEAMGMYHIHNKTIFVV